MLVAVNDPLTGGCAVRAVHDNISRLSMNNNFLITGLVGNRR